MTVAPAILVERADGLTVARLNRPDGRNALVAELKVAMRALVDDFVEDDAQRCLLITGVGDSFCAGGDVKSFAMPATAAENRARIQGTQHWAMRLLTCEKPVITAVNGAAAGAGFGLALLGDITLVADTGFFKPASPRIGVCPDALLGWTLVHRVGLARAGEILLDDRRVDAAEAVAIGLAARIVPSDQLLTEALELGRRLAGAARPAVGLTKRLLHAAATTDLAGYAELEAAYQGVAMSSQDHAEGVAAFLEKRRPRFGRQ